MSCHCYIGNDYFILIDEKETIFSINRKTYETVHVSMERSDLSQQSLFSFSFSAILGIYTIDDIKYVVFMKDSKEINYHFSIFEVGGIVIYPLSNILDHNDMKRLLEYGFERLQFFYSDQVDLTLTVTQQIEEQSTRDQFLFNSNPLAEFQRIFPGFTSYKAIIEGTIVFSGNFLIISRRSRHNVGFHFWSRGLDKNGNAANFVETEMIIFDNGQNDQFNIVNNLDNQNNGLNVSNYSNLTINTFIQLRGSSPIFYSQVDQLSFGSKEESFRRSNIHFSDLEMKYKSISYLCLTGNKGKE